MHFKLEPKPLVTGGASFLAVLAMASLLTLPVIAYSLYYQYGKAHTWCRLCLIIDGVLAVQAVLFAVMYYHQLFTGRDIGFLPFAISVCLLIAIAASVVLLKNRLKTAKTSARAETSANRVKHDPKVFAHLLLQGDPINTAPFEPEIRLGNEVAPIKILMAASLGCDPCGKELKKAVLLVSTYPDIVSLSIRFRFLRISKENPKPPWENMYFLIYWWRHVFEKSNANIFTEKLLKDWYKQASFEKFKNSYPLKKNSNDQIVGNLAAQHTRWMEHAGISKTPTFFLNGYQLPNQYRIEDLMAMLPGLAAMFNNQKNPKNRTAEKLLKKQEG